MWYPFVDEDASQQYRVEVRLQQPEPAADNERTA